jgi:hypothetical protein
MINSVLSYRYIYRYWRNPVICPKEQGENMDLDNEDSIRETRRYMARLE